MELIDGFQIYLTNADPGEDFIELAIGENNREFDITDGDTDVLTYEEASVDDLGDGAEFRLHGPEVVIDEGDRAQMENTDTYVTYDEDIDIIKETRESSASGSTVDSGKTPGSEFLTVDVTGTVLGGSAQAVSIPLVADTAVTDDDKDDYNLLVFGGPRANLIASQLVTLGMSVVDWDNSPGEIEVIEDAFSVGNDVAIIAGATRTETAAAAATAAGMI
jgi:hypothetical protein